MQELATKKCKIMQIKPDGTTMIMIGTYATEDEAKAARSKTTARNVPTNQKLNRISSSVRQGIQFNRNLSEMRAPARGQVSNEVDLAFGELMGEFAGWMQTI